MTRVEGEGEIIIIERGEVIESVIYRISESPRFFEYIVRGRDLQTVVDIVSRICGLCGVSYVYVASKAFEKCLGIDITEEIENLRVALHLIERIKSHMIHLFYLNLPDLVYTKSSIEFFDRNPEISRDALRVIAWSRKAMELLGGRFHNIVNIKVGGVYRAPDKDDVKKLGEELVSIVKSFTKFAEFYLSLRTGPEGLQRSSTASIYSRGYPHTGDYIFLNGSVYSISEFYGEISKCIQKSYSNALHYRIEGSKSYVVGPIARFNQFYNYLSKNTREFIELYGWKPPIENIFYGFVARIAETYEAIQQLEEFINNYKTINLDNKEPKKNIDHFVCEAAAEAPRGILYHRYTINENKKVISCDIVTPTAQNLAAIEDIALEILRGRKIDEKAISLARKIAIAFDPCLSCSVHAIPIKIIKAYTDGAT
ncbi:MAG: nickel-dependent hydrogenase large subunit [Ignisphaera sp.]